MYSSISLPSGVLDVQAVGDGVIGSSDHPYPRLGEPLPGFTQLLVGLADFEAEVVHPAPRPRRERRRVGTDLNQKQLVMRPT